MKALFIFSALISSISSYAAPELTCAQAQALAEQCKRENQPADASHAELERALSGYFGCIELRTGLSFKEANKKFAHCR